MHVQDQILKALRKEYRRRPGYPSELSGSDAQKDASYREGKILKYYEVKNRWEMKILINLTLDFWNNDLYFVVAHWKIYIKNDKDF